MSAQQTTVRIVQMRYEAPTIVSLELRRPDGEALPAFTAGAHVDLRLHDGCTRSYSLVNDQAERARYVIAVHRDPDSRGGSRRVHETLRVGDLVTIDSPRNNFPLNEQAASSVLIAGGIGVTPILGMIRRLNALRKTWELHYSARTRASAAFLDDIETLRAAGEGKVMLNFDSETGGRMLDLDAIVAAATQDAHLYCCGPAPMLAAFEKAAGGVQSARVHLEYFSGAQAAATSGDFELVLARSGKTLRVPPGRTILQVILEAKVDVNYACAEGVCGSCQTRVIEGAPDHRDNFLTVEEKSAGDTIMVCCSGSRSPKLVLDL